MKRLLVCLILGGVVISTIITLLGIWLEDDRWANTAILVWFLTVLPFIFAVLTWEALDDD